MTPNGDRFEEKLCLVCLAKNRPGGKSEREFESVTHAPLTEMPLPDEEPGVLKRRQYQEHCPFLWFPLKMALRFRRDNRAGDSQTARLNRQGLGATILASAAFLHPEVSQRALDERTLSDPYGVALRLLNRLHSSALG
jgi:hypothetical protein